MLKHQGLETGRHHSKILEELYTERDYLRKMNSQLIERQLKRECLVLDSSSTGKSILDIF